MTVIKEEREVAYAALDLGVRSIYIPQSERKPDRGLGEKKTRCRETKVLPLYTEKLDTISILSKGRSR